jgi:hypothetical protein
VPTPIPVAGYPWNCKTQDCTGGCSTYPSQTNQSASGTCYSTQCLQAPDTPTPCPGSVPVPIPVPIPVPVINCDTAPCDPGLS